MSEEDIYEVEKILDSRYRYGNRQFLVRWKGFDEDEDSWEPEKNLDCVEILKQFLLTHQDQNPKTISKTLKEIGTTNKVKATKSSKSGTMKSSKESATSEHDRLLKKLDKHRKRFAEFDSERTSGVQRTSSSTSSTFVSSSATSMSLGDSKSAAVTVDNRLSKLQQHADQLHRQMSLLPAAVGSSAESLSDWHLSSSPSVVTTYVSSTSGGRYRRLPLVVRDAWLMLLALVVGSIYVIFSAAWQESAGKNFGEPDATLKAAIEK